MHRARRRRAVRSAAALFVCMAIGRGPLTAQERTTFSAADGQPLVGTLRLPKEAPLGGALLLPARGSTRFAFDPLMLRLKDSGLAVLALDPRGHGDSAKDAAGRVIEVGKGASKDRQSGPFAAAKRDADAALAHLIAKGAPPGRIVVAAAGVSAHATLLLAGEERLRAFLLLTPDDEDAGLDLLAAAKGARGRPFRLCAASEDQDDAFHALAAALGASDSERMTPEGRLVRGTNMFGKVPGIEATLAGWIVDAATAPDTLTVPAGPTVVTDGEPAAEEAVGALFRKIPLEGGAAATVRMTRTKRTLDFAFDVPERYVRLNEVAVFIDGSGAGPRTIDQKCHRISFNPKNTARKPLIVQRGGLKGWEDTDDKGVGAFARVEDKRRWTAEISLDLERFAGGLAPRTVRLAFLVAGQRTSDLRYWPDSAQTPTSPRTWATATLD